MSSVEALRAHRNDKIGFPPVPAPGAWKPHVLASFATPNICEEIVEDRQHYGVAMLDSGAFSAYTQGEAIDLTAYMEYIKGHPQWDHAIQLDVLGNPEATLGNYLKMLRAGVQTLPVFQYRAPAEQLPIFAETTDYIAVSVTIGGRRASKRAQLLKHILSQCPDGLSCHVLGVGTPASMIRALRPYSCDTSSVNFGVYKRGHSLTRTPSRECREIKRWTARDQRREFIYGLRYANIPPARWTWDEAMRLELSFRVAVRHYYELEMETGCKHHFASSPRYFYERLLHAAHALREEGLIA